MKKRNYRVRQMARFRCFSNHNSRLDVLHRHRRGENVPRKFNGLRGHSRDEFDGGLGLIDGYIQ